MRKIVPVIVLLSLIGFSCEEEPLPIVFTPPPAPLADTTYINPSPSAQQDKIVLLEDFTGVRCPTCPNGHIAVKNILAANPGRVVGIAVHPGATEFLQAYPFPGDQDLNTPFGKQILDIITKPQGIPYGIADRDQGSTTTSSWESFVTSRLAVPAPINVSIDNITYDAGNREIRYKIRFEATQNITDLLFFSTVIVEDSISGKQEHTSGVYDPYNHMHILRHMPQFSIALNPGGNPALTAGRVFVKEYKFKLDDKWVVKNCKLAVYAHKSKEILQSAEKDIQ